ncbi:sulfatase-like hydrolase/transferase [Chitinophaga sp.]|uniref:sulfatase family protein n=1 Tax=Chitinophaga sp. TaxID=1869181 RepID=UPI0031D5FF8B
MKNAFAACFVLTLFAACTTPEKKPNVILIVTDDQGYADLSAYSHVSKDCTTPNMDRIAKSGVLFTNGYASAPVCSPSRAAIYTGKYQQRWDSAMYWSPGLPGNVRTLAEMLKSAGYTTQKIGKSDYGKHYHTANAREFPTRHGYDHFLGFSAHAHDYFLLDEDIEKATPDPYGPSEALGRLFRDTTKESFRNTYTTDLFTDEAIRFINEQENGQPFFLDLSYNAVHHLIHEVPQKYLNKWGVRKIPDYDTAYGKYAQYYWDYTQVNKITDDEMRRYYLANLNCLDDNIGRLLDALNARNLLENTLIIFVSDNGGEPLSGANNLPLCGSKYTMHEGGIRVPFMMAWPGKLPEGKVYSHRVSALDIVPTALEAAGINNTTQFDGVSILQPVKANRPSAAAAAPLCFQFDKHYAVIDGPWKLVHTFDYNPADRPITSQILLGAHNNELALYNLEKDPGERENLLEKEPAVAARLKEQFARWKAAMREDHHRYR